MLHPELIRAIHQDRQREIEAHVRERLLVAALSERHVDTAADTSILAVAPAIVPSGGSRAIESSRPVATAPCAATPRVPGQLG